MGMNQRADASAPSIFTESLVSLLTLGARAESSSNRVIVLCYHSIHPTSPFASATPAGFEVHLQWLRDYCRVIPFSQVLDTVRTNGRRKPSVAP